MPWSLVRAPGHRKANSTELEAPLRIRALNRCDRAAARCSVVQHRARPRSNLSTWPCLC